MMNKILILLTILINFFVLYSCKKETPGRSYITENIIVIVVDGARYSETWGDSAHQYIPNTANTLSKFGVINTQFYNNGPTYTLAGHTAITTGVYQEINNSGMELPSNPSFFQSWNKKNVNKKEFSWIIASKDKLEVLHNCLDTAWNDRYQPNTDCGISGLSSGYRHDSITTDSVDQILSKFHPKLLLINFREPDYSGHTGNWDNYLKGIMDTDKYLYQIFENIRNDPFYKGKTTIFITNDHGRHLDSISNGFVSHGDGCSGCRHLFLFAFGPDFKENIVLDNPRELIDIYSTISEMLHIETPNGRGEIMLELFK